MFLLVWKINQKKTIIAKQFVILSFKVWYIAFQRPAMIKTNHQPLCFTPYYNQNQCPLDSQPTIYPLEIISCNKTINVKDILQILFILLKQDG